jgi:hypothetical protein
MVRTAKWCPNTPRLPNVFMDTWMCLKFNAILRDKKDHIPQYVNLSLSIADAEINYLVPELYVIPIYFNIFK